MVSQWIGILATKVWWIACASWSSAGDQGEENGSEDARGGSEEVQVYAMERGKKSLWKTLEERHALRKNVSERNAP
jgi:hypothetical protein